MTCQAIKKVEIKQCKFARDPYCAQWQKEEALRLQWYRDLMTKKLNGKDEK